MLQIAGETTGGNTNVRLKRLDMKNLEIFCGYFDVAFAVNTVAPESPKVARRIPWEIFRSLRPGGLFVDIFPAFDAVLHQRELTYTSCVRNGLAPTEAWQKMDDYFVAGNKLDSQGGMYADDGVHSQKFFTEEEIPSSQKRSVSRT